MKNNSFFTTYEMLSAKHKKIIFNILLKMEHSNFSRKIINKPLDIRGNIKKKQKEAELTDQQVCDYISDFFKKELSLDEYRHIRNKNVQKPKKWLSYIAFVLDTTVDELRQGKSREHYINLSNMSNDLSNVHWLYASLNSRDKEIIFALARELQLLELS